MDWVVFGEAVAAPPEARIPINTDMNRGIRIFRHHYLLIFDGAKRVPIDDERGMRG